MSQFAQGVLWGTFMVWSGYQLVQFWPPEWKRAFRIWQDERRCMSCGRVEWHGIVALEDEQVCRRCSTPPERAR